MPLPVGIGWRHPHYSDLLEQRPKLDFLEVHSENFFASGGAALAVLERGRAHYPVSLHGVGLSLGSVAGLDAWHLDQLELLVKRIDPVRVSDHASFARGLVREGMVHAADLLPIPFTTEALQVLSSNVDRVQDRLQRPLLVENLSFYLSWQHSLDETIWEEPAFLAELTRRSGCQLLVDINNIYVNALNAHRFGNETSPMQACVNWLNAIPVAAVGEIHLAGHCTVSDEQGDFVIDDHGSCVAQPVWELYAHALSRFKEVPVLVEWDTDIPPLALLLEQAERARLVSATGQRQEAA